VRVGVGGLTLKVGFWGTVFGVPVGGEASVIVKVKPIGCELSQFCFGMGFF